MRHRRDVAATGGDLTDARNRVQDDVELPREKLQLSFGHRQTRQLSQMGNLLRSDLNSVLSSTWMWHN